MVASEHDLLAMVILYHIGIGMGLDRRSDTIGPRQSYLMVQSLPRLVGVHTRWYSSPELMSSCVTTLLARALRASSVVCG